MNIRQILFALLIANCSLLQAQDRDYSTCIVKSNTEWGAVCERCEYYKDGYVRSYDETFTLTLKNVCTERVEVKVAMQEKNGKWRTFPVHFLEKDQSFKAYACKGSGKYLYWVRRADDSELILPTDAEIISEYKDY